MLYPGLALGAIVSRASRISDGHVRGGGECRVQPGDGAPARRVAAPAHRRLAQRVGDRGGGRRRGGGCGGFGRSQIRATSFNRCKTRCGSRSIAASTHPDTESDRPWPLDHRTLSPAELPVSAFRCQAFAVNEINGLSAQDTTGSPRAVVTPVAEFNKPDDKRPSPTLNGVPTARQGLPGRRSIPEHLRNLSEIERGHPLGGNRRA